ncbi:hypothetical protein MHZ92_13720 [Sporosarcina sp. ACRSL]|uniref:hypothetical protein n=1 Tax=Sporosarcina sp. ACRSL TaxID=2918215 RepID=UPI001EF713BF|nr:hypothetical protein [Sporosarcina sp. ACRSL]MCG7345198.1 hypothetical protein [Sporosarcina sp. ACRSL]
MKMYSLCEEIKELWKEQQLLAEFGKGFRFIHVPQQDTIPFMLLTADHLTPFTAIIEGDSTPYFRVEHVYEGSYFVQLSLLKPIDLKGQHAHSERDLFSLKKTTQNIVINISKFSTINPLSHDLVGRPLPIIESKT